MGNHQQKSCCSCNQSSKLSHSLKCKLKKCFKNKSKQNNDEFIVNYVQNNCKIKINDIKFLDQRRVVFISLMGLYNTWKSCPAITLYSSIFILPLKRDWIYYPTQYTNEIKSTFISQLTMFTDTGSAEINEFIKLLKWKDKNGLVFWMLNDYKCDKNDSLIHPFWIDVNVKLSNLYDPITTKLYNPINLDEKQWKSKPVYMSKYGYVESVEILSELFCLTMRYKTISTILRTSNPKSFHVIKSYNKKYINIIECNNKIYDNIYDEFKNKENVNDWWISSDYNPYDMD